MDQAWEKAWPFWKFGFKYNDLTTVLQDKYNTISSPIQDPDAFHHDVYEISSRADNLAEFERLMQERKALRIKELNGMLEDASFEIVGNPDLIGTDQWALAVQLFRTRSLDSLVRYFASYLPADHPWHYDADSPVDSSESEAPSPIDYDGPMLFDEPEEDEPIHTNQPSECCSIVDTVADQPSRSMSMRSEDSGVSVGGRFQRSRKALSRVRSPARAMSIFDGEFDQSSASLQNSIAVVDESASLTHDSQTPSTSISDLSYCDEQDSRKNVLVTTVLDEDTIDGFLSISRHSVGPMGLMDSKSSTPTPKSTATPPTVGPVSPFLHTKPSPLQTADLSTGRSHPHHAHLAHSSQHRSIHQVTARRLRKREDSLDREVLNRRHVGKSNRARQVTPETTRVRKRPRRRHAIRDL